ncbi:hypothetical protein GNI_147830 [Gregarina niphandrodes]|uniref:CBF1-interacting co-repressor CIR N-terminal domain-containing protein n=1 Tax=Gregarina niphandrodes TaxID=110365 RepID=A0A023AZV1_GRENI|nr:hypothetical protein GNI_147830 [Gregarina niphandrodes]EZG44395.1 hypothetical protein GNI_147830 [Gregarina niphandrodes]|eukprot:XP_011132673.1 hypothetical protein GNI_147830 [Gregarina niphandrodes]
MGGHGALNILPDKKWNVYNLDNRLKVDKLLAEHRAAAVAEHRSRLRGVVGARLKILRDEKARGSGRGPCTA